MRHGSCAWSWRASAGTRRATHELEYLYLKALGGWKGMYPIANLDWSVVAMLDSLPARLAVQHRTFEAGSLDMETSRFRCCGTWACDTQAEVTDAIDADEIQHVRFANEWLRRMTDAQPRAVLEIAAAMAWLRQSGGGDRSSIR